MKELKFETGLVTYSLNGKCEVSFNPTDSAFVEKLCNAYDELERRQKGYKEAVKENEDKREILHVANRMDQEMREIINGVFNADICGALFGDMNVYALAGGFPVWANLIISIMEEVEGTFAQEQKTGNTRIAKYTKKYHK